MAFKSKTLKKLNYKKGSNTKKGTLNKIRIITKNHTIFSKFFNDDGTKKNEKEVLKSLNEVNDEINPENKNE